MRGCSSIASNTGAAHLQRKTQKADRFWFAPGAAKKAGQWRLRTRRCCNHAGLFLDRPKHRSRAPSTENAKKRTVLVRTREDKTESIDYFKGGMSGVLKLYSGRKAPGETQDGLHSNQYATRLLKQIRFPIIPQNIRAAASAIECEGRAGMPTVSAYEFDALPREARGK
jgi:hypothetical protein